MITSIKHQWKERFEMYAASGLTKTAFCRQCNRLHIYTKKESNSVFFVRF